MISVIIPVYNRSEYIERCINSILSQTFPIDEIEIIVVDDASTDESLNIVKNLERQYPNNILLVECNENSGGFVGKVRNIGLEYARGDYITFVDSDDTIEKECLEKLYNAAIYHEAEVVDGGISLIKDQKLCGEILRGDNIFNICDDIQRRRVFLKYSLDCSANGKLYKKSFLLDFDIQFFENIKVGEDNSFYERALLFAEKIITVNDVVYNYRINDESVWHSEKTKEYLFDIINSQEMIYEIIKTHAEYLLLEFTWTFYGYIFSIRKKCFEKFWEETFYENLPYIKDKIFRLFPDICNNQYIYVDQSDENLTLQEELFGDYFLTVTRLINEEKYSSAANLFVPMVQKDGFNEKMAICGASICEGLGDFEGEEEYIYRGLEQNPFSYELYFMLGRLFLNYNVYQAYLCIENAIFYAKKACQYDDAEYIESIYKSLKNNESDIPHRTSIVILSFNTLQMTKECIESIEKTVSKEMCEIVVVDNCSTDGSVEFLRTKNNIVLIENTENKGFPGGCNIGIEAAEKGNDILLLNSDVIVPENAIFNLRMCLYSDESIGASGSVSNEVSNGQQIEEEFDTIEEYIKYAESHINVYRGSAYENKAHLVGFAMLIKRIALEKVGYLDERFTPGNYEDDDICMRLALKGYRSVCCHNSFIFHYGHGSFNEVMEISRFNDILIKNSGKFIDKWGVSPDYVGLCWEEIIRLIQKPSMDHFKVLEIGCGGGNDLNRIKYLYPNAEVYGTEKSELLSKANSVRLTCYHLDIEKDILPFEKEMFDYIILNEFSETYNDVELVLKKVDQYVLPNNKGCVIRANCG